MEPRLAQISYPDENHPNLRKDETYILGLADKEGTGVYYTAGVSKGIGEHLSLYAEGEMADLDTGTDTTSYSIGTKFTF